MSERYPSDLTDREWALVQATFEPDRPLGGRPRKHNARELVDAILYVMKNGCPWRALPKDFPPWQTVVTARRRWIADGTLGRAAGALARARPTVRVWQSWTLSSSSPATAEKTASSAA